MRNIEIEIQVKIENSHPLSDFLQKNAEFKGEKRQIDEYLTPAHRDFLAVRPVKEWLRLRNVDGNYAVNYKNWHYDKDGKSNHCDEYETEVKDFDQVKKILDALDFKSLTVVDKLRKIWTYKDYEISMDMVNGLGNFVEIEYVGKDDKADPKKITDEMVNFLKELDCGKIEKNYKGYPFLLLFPDEAEHEEQ